MAGIEGSDVRRHAVAVVLVRAQGLDALRQDAEVSARVFLSAAAGWASAELLGRLGWTNVYLHGAVIALVVTLFWVPLGREIWKRYKETGQVFFAEETSA